MNRNKIKKLLADHIVSYLELHDHVWLFDVPGVTDADAVRLVAERELMANWMRKKYRLPKTTHGDQ